ncbi:C6 zinc finger domain-containing protein [Colletotrichum musicola]|uniref:C6 zinc finger domain-containing protein n=1 Tax=Colletotrichum musicola TaxID=2175873 RepID=A0A8H6KE76_9PEZI|nr:C6 zinc finger domain-containing protein [Colletotrichum musicola]
MADDTESVSGAAAVTVSAEAGAGGSGGNASKARHKRTRTGCLKCRMRRRKCDEGKPRCQRCIDGNFECQYGPRLTFLNKNALTVSPSPRATEAGTPKYSRLQIVNTNLQHDQFVGPGSSKQQAAKEASPSSPAAETKLHNTVTSSGAVLSPGQHTPTVLTFQTHPHPQPHPPEPPTPKPHPIEPGIAPNNYPPPQQQQVHHWRAQSIGHESLSSPVRNLDIAGRQQQQQLQRASPNNDAAYETALNVLLSLGSEGTPAGMAQSPGPGPGHLPMGGVEGMGVSPRDLMSVSPNSTRDERSSSTARTSIPGSIPQDRLLQLLRHFRYQVAPWLDLCDMSQTFGLYVPRLAIESEAVLHSVMALAAISSQADSRVVQPGDMEYIKALVDAAAVEPSGLVSFSDSDLSQLTLSTACRFILNIPGSWHELPLIISDGFWNMALANATPKTISILSVLIRLELAAALVTGSPISIPEQLSCNPPISQHWSSSSSAVAETIFQYTMEPLLLCAKVANFCAGGFPPQTPTDVPPVHRWTMLSDALGAWYASRAQEFRPMVEMDGGGGDGDEEEKTLFPIILFTNGAAVFANQLYHTAMLLLLQNRPRTLQTAAATGAKKSSSVSPLWHAQRVCGIALNNDRRDSWDLCLVASLYLAAQRMTYEPQQRAVLECFERVRTLTGWNVEGFAARVREDWGFV